MVQFQKYNFHFPAYVFLTLNMALQSISSELSTNRCFFPSLAGINRSKHGWYGHSLQIGRFGLCSYSASQYNRPYVPGRMASFHSVLYYPQHLDVVPGRNPISTSMATATLFFYPHSNQLNPVCCFKENVLEPGSSSYLSLLWCSFLRLYLQIYNLNVLSIGKCCRRTI